MRHAIPLRFWGLAIAALTGAIPGRAEGEFSCGTVEGGHGRSYAKPSMSPLPRLVPFSGTLKALVFRVEFSDAPSNVSEDSIKSANASINAFYKEMSRGKFHWEFSIHPQVLKAPNSRNYYSADAWELFDWIDEAVKATGLTRNVDYHVYNATFPLLSIMYEGLSVGGTSGQNYLNGSYKPGVTSHELGHTLDLGHGHAIEAGASDMFGTPGNENHHIEYGNPFDVMGRGLHNGHFNICYKYRLGWTSPGGIEVIEVTKSGVYRIYAHDNPDPMGRLLGIRVPAGNPAYGYWFEYRSNKTTNRKGAYVMFDGFLPDPDKQSKTWLMDLTPNTTTDKDAYMVPGMEFKDKLGSTTFKVVAINEVEGKDGWVDVQVNWNGISAPVLAHGSGPMGGGWKAAPGYTLLGQAVERLSANQALAVRPRENAAFRLRILWP